jgi:hypothetical protein
VFETVLRRCIQERLVGGEGFAVDASLIKADANRQKGIEGDKGLPPEAAGRAIEEYLAVLDDAAFGAATEVTPKFVGTVRNLVCEAIMMTREGASYGNRERLAGSATGWPRSQRRIQ